MRDPASAVAQAAARRVRGIVGRDLKNPPENTAPLSTRAAERIREIHLPRRSVLLLISHREGALAVPLEPHTPVIVGRKAPADVVIPDVSLSRLHAQFALEDGEVVVEDRGSTNGTHIGGRRIERAIVAPGDEVMLGGVIVAVHVVAGGDVPALALEGHESFRAAVAAEVQRARFFGRGLAVIMVRAPGPEDGAVHRWSPGLRGLIRPVDRMGLYSADSVEILCPEATSEQALEVARAISVARDPAAALLCGVASFPGGAASADELIGLARDAVRRADPSARVHVALSEREAPGPAGGEDAGLVAESGLLRAVVAQAKRFARSSMSLLLHGETGTGKEALARFIHDASPRRGKPFLAVNCGAIPTHLVESTFVGHERGAFTGAVQKHEGIFEAAEGGTVLLDEIGDLPAAMQASLLRVLDTERVTRVGSTKEIALDVRVLAATHRDLEAMCAARTFRADLFHRLGEVVEIPPLRRRPQDIAPLARRFVRQYSEREGIAARPIDPEAMALLERYPWPGNARELGQAIERAVVLADGDAITALDLPERIVLGGRGVASAGEGESVAQSPAAVGERGAAESKVGVGVDERAKDELDRIFEALRKAGWNQTKAAQILGMPLRTLQHKIKKHGIKRRYEVE